MTERVLIARQDNHGDVLLAGPAVRAVAAAGRRVTLLCGPRGRAAAELLPGVDELIVRQAEWIDPEPPALDTRATLDFVADLGERRFHEAIVLTSFHQSPLPLALLLRLAGVPRLAAISDDYPGSLLDVRHRVPDDIHEVERSLSLMATLGYELPPGDDGCLRICGAEPDPEFAEHVVVHPGASVSARAWEPEHHRELVDALVERGRRVAVTGAPGERELTAYVAGRRRPEVVDLGGRTELSRLARVLAAASAVVVGNTGPAHLAAAVGTPVISLYAPTLPAERWRPWKVPHELLYVDVPCAGCRARECPVPGHPCLSGVTVDDVLGAVERLAPSRERTAA